MIRLILIVLSIAIFFLLSLPFFLVEWLIGKKWPHARDISMLRVVQAFCKFLLFLAGVKLTIRGREKLPADQAVLYIINHRSYFDIVITLAYMPGPTGYIGKKEIAKFPVLNLWMSLLHGYFLDRQDLRQALKTILAAIDEVKNGISIAIFPEGTRNKNELDSQLLDFHEGSFKIATKSNCPIVPIALSNTRQIFEAHMPKIKSTSVVMEYGDPIYVDKLTREEQKFLGRKVQEKMVEMLTAHSE